MFINPKVFKRLCQQAWKSQSLHIEHIDRPEASWYMIRSDWWQVEVRADFLTNIVKANLIEMIGDLPNVGECVLYGKDEDPQMEIEEIYFADLVEGAFSGRCKETYEPTKLLLHSMGANLTIMQEESSMRKTLINSVFMDLLDGTLIDTDKGECPVSKAMAIPEQKTILWANNVMALQCHQREPRYKKEAFIMKCLEREDMLYTFTIEEEIGQ